MARVLILYATVEGHTARIAQRIASGLAGAGHGVELHRVVRTEAALDLATYAGVIVGASVHYGRHPGHLRALLRKHRTALAARPGAFFSVSLSANERYAARFLGQVGWRPQQTATFAGALQYRKYGPIKRVVVKAFAAIGGHDTDTSRDYDYTNWKAVDSFATAFLRNVS